MNVRATLAAEGLPRRAFTVDDVLRMVDVGLIGEDERLELIGGELVPMSPKGSRHEVIKRALLNRWLRGELDPTVDVIVETTLRLDGLSFVEPDIVLVAARTRLDDLVPSNVLLVIEIADSSLGYDLGPKPAIYAAHGLRERWVIDVTTRQTHVHREPSPSGYRSVTVTSAELSLEPQLLPHLSVTLANLPLDE
jgi:Uma2 family endonuclease